VPLPDDTSCAGTYLLTGGTGFEIKSVQGKRVTVRNYPFVGGEDIVIPHSLWFGPD